MSAITRSSALVTVPALVAAALLLAGCKEQAAAPDPIRPVKAMVVSTAASERHLSYSGAVEARISAGLGFRVGGKIVARLVNVGDRVEAGTTVARLDPADLRLALQAAEAAVEGAKARVQVARDALERNRSLFEKGHVAKAALDKASLETDQAVAALDSAVSARDQALNQIGYADLKADGPGIVTEVRGEAGQVVAAGAAVVTIARDGEKEARIAVPEQDIRHFRKGDMVEVRYWAEPDLVHTGRVREVAGSADAISRTFAVRIALPEDERLRLGQTATVTASVPSGPAAVVVPLAALAQRPDGTVVWVVDRTSETVSARRVTIGPTAPAGVRIVEGLGAGDLVVTAGAQFMTEGRKIRLAGSEIATAHAAP